MSRHNKYGQGDDVMLQDGDTSFMRMNTRLRPSQLQPGEVSVSENGRMDTNGTWQPREGYDNITGALAQDGVALYAFDVGEDGIITLFDPVAISAAALVSGVVTITTATPHGLTGVQTVWIDDLGFSGVDPNGNRVVTAITDLVTLTFALADSGDEIYTTGSTPTVESPKLDDSSLVEVLGSCVYSDPNDDADEYVVIATTNQAIAYKLSAADIPASAVDIAFPGSDTLSDEVEMIQAFDKVFLFQGGKTAWEWDGDLTGTPAFIDVPSGAKIQHRMYQTASNTTIASGLATVTELTHGLEVGDEIHVIESDLYDVGENQRFLVATAADANTFTYYVNAEDGTATVIYSTGASDLGGGFTNMPAAPWGVYHQRRMWVPYFWDDAATPASRGVMDELVASDILDPATFDPIGNQYRITAGIADFLVTVHPFNEDNLLAFNRNSIHLMKGVSGSLSDVQTVEITREIGCAARKSAVTYGNSILFLSDNGIYSLSFQDEYNLRGTEMPLSEAIDSLIARINKDAFQKAVGVYHDNRYFLSVPLDDSTENNSILVYSFLNGGWESLDFTAATSFNVLNFHVGRSGEYNELYAVTTTGGLYKLSDTARVTDELINSVVSNEVQEFSIPSSVTTRQYTMGTIDRKKWNRLELQLKSNETSASDGGISVSIEDPDNDVTLSTVSGNIGTELGTGEAATLTSRIGNNRGHGATVTFTPTLGRPYFRAVRLQAVENFKSGTTVK